MDSGVDMINGNDEFQRSSGTNSTIGNDENEKLDSILTKFAQNATYLVEQVKEKLIAVSINLKKLFKK